MSLSNREDEKENIIFSIENRENLVYGSVKMKVQRIR